jgi:hypothetical protein
MSLTRDQRLDIGLRISKVLNQTSGVRGQMSEVGCLVSGKEPGFRADIRQLEGTDPNFGSINSRSFCISLNSGGETR